MAYGASGRNGGEARRAAGESSVGPDAPNSPRTAGSLQPMLGQGQDLGQGRMNEEIQLSRRRRGQARLALADHPTPESAAEPAGPAASEPGSVPPAPSDDGWSKLRPLVLDPVRLDRNRIVTGRRRDPAHASFDVLRTKIIQILNEQGWTRVGITSPTKGCGKSFVSLNLAVSLSRYKHCRTVLLDMDLRQPTVARKLGVRFDGAISDFLRGRTPPEKFLYRVSPGQLHIGEWLAVGLNSQHEPFASELFFEEATGQALARMEETLAPRVVLFDLPPVLAQDDVLALTPHMDCVLLVAGGGLTTSRQLIETSRRLGDSVPILAIVLNRAEGEDIQDYSY